MRYNLAYRRQAQVEHPLYWTMISMVEHTGEEYVRYQISPNTIATDNIRLLFLEYIRKYLG